MRIGLIYLGRRGAGEWISLELAKHLQDRFSVYGSISFYAEQRSKWEAQPIDLFVTRTYLNPISALLSLLMPVRPLQLIHRIKSCQPDVLLFPMFHPWNAIIQMGMQKTPSVVFVHDPHPHPDLTGWFYAKLEQMSIQRAGRCIIMSRRLLYDLMRRGVSMEKIDIIPLGPYRTMTPRKLRVQKHNFPKILFFGRIVPYKGLGILLQAYAKLRQEYQACLVIAGEGDLKPFQDILVELPDVEIINHWVADEEVENLFSQSNLLVLPYTSASQSGVIPMAASFSLPVIATDVGGIPEQIEDGISGWLVRPDSPEALWEALVEALIHPDIAHERGEALRIRYESQFSWEEITRQVAESLKKAVQTTGHE